MEVIDLNIIEGKYVISFPVSIFAIRGTLIILLLFDLSNFKDVNLIK